MKKIVSLLFNMLVLTCISAAFGAPVAVAVGALSLIPTGVQGLRMAVQVEIWENDIVESLWASNQFLQYAYNADSYVLAGKVVHIPQAGAAPGTKVNRTELPATVTRRTDTDVTYAIDEITSDPVHIPNAEDCELSYDKRQSVLGETKAAINEVSALNILYRWAPTIASQIIRTSGENVAAHLDKATGSRKAMTIGDLKRAQAIMNRNNVPTADRYALIDADMYDQFTNDMSANQQRDFLAAYDEASGVAGRLYGFNIIMRAKVLKYNNAATVAPVKWETAGVATDNAAVLCWQKNSVERALGDVKFFERLRDPQYYGDIYSALVRLGGRIRRADGAGVVAIVQAAAAD